jgi:DNA-binding NtrC family response regulator
MATPPSCPNPERDGRALRVLNTVCNMKPIPGAGTLTVSEQSAGDRWAEFNELSRQLFEWARHDPELRMIPAMERAFIMEAMTRTEGNQVQAAKLLGITRATLRKRLQRFNIQRRTIYSVSGLPATNLV